MYCYNCDKNIDTDFDGEHFEECVNQYVCYIKSHCEYPDFEYEVEANSKEEAVDKIKERFPAFSREHIEKHTGAWNTE